MTVATIDALRRALAETERLITAVRPDQWTTPTPCPDWDVRAVATHIVSGNRMFAAILRGEVADGGAGPAPGPVDPREVDVLGDDPPAAFHAAADDLLDAAEGPGVMQQSFTVPFGTVPGAVALHLRTTEALVHGWDLAQATGQEPRFPDDIVDAELEFSRRALPAVSSTRSPFGPPQPVAEDAPAIDRLAALLGRPVMTQGGR